MNQVAPVVPHRVDLDRSPVEVAEACRHLPGLVFFDSSTENAGEQLSMIAAQPSEIFRGNLWAKTPLEGVLSPEWLAFQKAVAARQMTARTDDGLPHGFAAGFLEYEGNFCFGFYEHALLYRHADESWHELGNLRALMEAASQAGAPENTPDPVRQPCAPPRFVSQMDGTDFRARVARAQEYIAAGDIYQVNLSHRFEAAWAGDAFALYEALRHYSPAPYAAFLHLEGRAILSSSPELFLKMSGHAIRTRPIKGTRPRRAEAHADEKSAYDLITSPKEIAELVMITDLERNDLGTVCEFGSVRVKELLKLERFEHVFHLVSTVEGRLVESAEHVGALAACFPGGSITGAPKRRAREIIAELEDVPRGIYTGVLGWFGFNGESQFNIAIRTVVVEADRAHFHVGAGIVADSVPAHEWQETLDKAAGILLAAERLE